MLSNKSKINSESLKSLAYPAILLIYVIGMTIIFFYFLKFVTQNINLAFAPAANQKALEESVQLNLKDYQALATKMKWETPATTTNPAAVSDAPIIPTLNTASSTDIPTSAATASNPVVESPLVTPAINIPTETATAAPTVIEKSSWKISVINSTTRTGLAGELKKRLEAVGYQVVKIGNQKELEVSTIIGLKTGLDRNSPEIIEINQIVSQKYNFTVATLAADNAYDIEIIIGNQ